jgi:hypothetical protein
MTEELEAALRRTFMDAAERAPKAPPGIGLERRSRKKPRGYPRMALVAAAVAVAIGGATVGGRTLMSGSGKNPSTATSPKLHAPKKVAIPPIEKVWPKAAFRVPDTLPDGRGFEPVDFIDAHTIVVSTQASFEKANALYAYDLRTRGTRLITQVVTPPKTKVFASGFTTGSGYLAWWFGGDYGIEVWAAPISGGQARLVGRMDGREPSQLAISGKTVYWSPGGTGGIYHAPVTGGGTVRETPGSRSTYILDWPWVGSPPTLRGESVKRVAFAELKNVLTGETRSARLTDRATWNCGLTWCVGQGPGFVTEVQRRDGSGRQALPGGGATSQLPPLLDRFVIIAPPGETLAVHDLRTGRTGDLGIVRNSKDKVVQLPTGPANRLYFTMTKGGYVIVDLGAI